MKLEHMLMTDGYVGQLGKTWKTPTQDDLEKAIAGAMEMNDMSRDQVVAALESGKGLKWCKSPNFYYDHSYGMIGRKREAPTVDYPDGRRLDCGHVVYNKHEVMAASLGTSCPDCYDRMSD